MELTNEQRKYLGLELVESSWERVEIPNSSKSEFVSGKEVLYFDGDVIRKIISIHNSGKYLENTVYLKTLENRTMLAPKTERGKAKKLNASNLEQVSAKGMYFCYTGKNVIIANYTTQQTYFSSDIAGLGSISEDGLQDFLRQWISDTDEEELKQIQEFATAKRRHCKFNEGDFFRFKIDRKHYGYGRILLDVMKMEKNGIKFWDILMGRPLVVSVYHIITEYPNVDIQELIKLKSCPSQYIMDNVFYYGEYEIIGNLPLAGDVDYPVMYGRSISYLDSNKIIFQKGPVYKEILLDKNTLIGQYDFKNNAIGCDLNIDKNILEACIEEDSNTPYWENNDYYSKHDVRNPKYKKEYDMIMEQMCDGSN